MSKAKVSKVVSTNVPVGPATPADVAVTNTSLENVLRKRRSAEVTVYGVPDGSTDIFRRRILTAKQDAKQHDVSDVPDIEDCYYTDLPWLGYVTFRNSSRQFRAKTILGVVVDVVREFDGFLYHMVVDQVAKPAAAPVLVQKKKASGGGVIEFTVQRDIPDAEFIEHFVGIPQYTESLLKHMKSLGYVHDAVKDWFYTPGRPNDDKIVITRYGKIVDHLKPAVVKEPKMPPRRRALSGLDVVREKAVAQA